MEKQHEVVAERSERVRTLLETWRRTPVDGEALATALDEFTAALVEHLDDEEAHVVPLMRAHITAEEWTRFGQETFEKFTNPEKLVATGTLEEVATREEADVVHRRPPAPDQADVATLRPPQVRPLHAAGQGSRCAMMGSPPATDVVDETAGRLGWWPSRSRRGAV